MSQIQYYRIDSANEWVTYVRATDVCDALIDATIAIKAASGDYLQTPVLINSKGTAYNNHQLPCCLKRTTPLPGANSASEVMDTAQPPR